MIFNSTVTLPLIHLESLIWWIQCLLHFLIIWQLNPDIFIIKISSIPRTIFLPPHARLVSVSDESPRKPSGATMLWNDRISIFCASQFITWLNGLDTCTRYYISNCQMTQWSSHFGNLTQDPCDKGWAPCHLGLLLIIMEVPFIPFIVIISNCILPYVWQLLPHFLLWMFACN